MNHLILYVSINLTRHLIQNNVMLSLLYLSSLWYYSLKNQNDDYYFVHTQRAKATQDAYTSVYIFSQFQSLIHTHTHIEKHKKKKKNLFPSHLEITLNVTVN